MLNNLYIDLLREDKVLLVIAGTQSDEWQGQVYHTFKWLFDMPALQFLIIMDTDEMHYFKSLERECKPIDEYTKDFLKNIEMDGEY